MSYKSCSLSILLFILWLSGNAQNNLVFYQSNLLTVIGSKGDTIIEPFTGGLKFPVISSIDLNNDSKNDLIVLDRSDNRLMTFINMGIPGKPLFQYRPQFELSFPKIEKYILLKDYNGDLLPDLFTFSSDYNSGFEVYLNTSTAYNISFKRSVNQISSLYFGTSKASVYYNGLDIPVFEDMDGDGDLDILTFGVIGQYMDYYENQSIEKYGISDSLDFEFADQCWGKFKEDELTNKIKLASSCGEVRGPVRHSGSASTLIDLDDDKDFDLLLSDVQYPEVFALINGRKEKSWFRDSIIQIKNNFPDYDIPINIRSMPATYYLDVDNDGIKDMIASPLDMEIIDTFQNLNQIWLYLNNGKNSKPNFVFNSSSFLQENMLDFGGRSSPAFFDYDLDGDPDLFVATIGDFYSSYYQSDKIVLFENIGTLTHPVFKLNDNDYLKISSLHLAGISPAFGDLDNDGDADMILGLSNGMLAYFENIAAINQKADFIFKTQSLQNIDIGDYSKPAIADLNDDGYSDLVIGERDGNLNYFKNKAISGTPDFNLISDSFGSVKFPISQRQYSAPYLFDLNGNGNMDMILGIRNGEIYYYPDITHNLNGVFTQFPIEVRDTTCRCVNKKPLGNRLSPAVAFLDGDTKADIILGSERGGLLLYTSRADTVNISIPENSMENKFTVNVFPNPANDFLTLKISSSDNNDFYVCNVLDITGKTCMTKHFEALEAQILDISALSKGVYLMQIKKINSGFSVYKKVIVNR